MRIGYDQWVVAGLLVFVPVLFWRSAANPFQQPKSTLLLLGGFVVALLLVARAVQVRSLALPRSPVLIALLAWIVFGVLSTAVSDATRLSFWGDQTHAAGLALYLACCVLLLAVATEGRVQAVRTQVWALGVAVGIAGLYGVVQAAGWDPFEWAIDLSGSTSTLGQPNFAAGFLGAASPAMLGASVLLRRWRALIRVALGLASLLGVGATLATTSSQGAAALSAGAALMLVVGTTGWLRTTDAAGRRRLLLAGGAVVGVALVAAVAARSFVETAIREGIRGRLPIWQAAQDLVADHPLTGTGLDTFALYFNAYRPAEHGAWLTFTNAEAPHSVPLAMFASGGWPLGLTYLAFVALIGWQLVLGLRRLDGEARLLLGLVGSVWIGYHVQSLVSIDIPPLVLLHAWSAGAIVALADGPIWQWSRSKAGPRKRPQPIPLPVGAALLAVAIVGGVWLSGPLRADVAGSDGFQAAQAGNAAEAQQAFERATAIAPYRAFYWYLHASFLVAADQTAAALPLAEEAARRDFGNSRAALLAGELAAVQGDHERARRWYLEAVDRDPNNPRVLDQTATYLRAQGHTGQADALDVRRAALEALDPSGSPIG